MAKSPLNFDKTIAGFNVTEHGVKSYTKSWAYVLVVHIAQKETV
jgi:hypothetical protein